MKRHFAALLLICGTLTLNGCSFVGREFTTFGQETAAQVAALDLVSFDIGYMNDLNRNSTRSDEDALQMAAAEDAIWRNHVAHYAPKPSDVVVTSARGTYSMPGKLVEVVPPPAKTEIERLQNSDIFIIRTAEGEITVTNKADQK